MRINLPVLDIPDDREIVKVHQHYIDLLDDRIVWMADFNSNEVFEEERGVPIRRYWNETYYKKNIAGYGYYRARYKYRDLKEDAKLYWFYWISSSGVAKDITLLFETKREADAFDRQFKEWMGDL